ncbi:MAG: cobalt ECF transporter T component CbiQ [Desulfovibrio sp.]|uniref:cobalt ECF transporter T component CbiQ n=1 Tax=Desulfovibrio sp. 7SRBS1 TaxID=3378064 RepID=UPI003B3DFB14
MDTTTTSAPLLHLHPAFRLAGAAVFAVAAALLHNPLVALCGCVPAFALLPFSGFGKKKALRRLLATNGFVLFLWATVPWTYPGQTLLSLGPLTITREGVMICLLVTLKANAIMAAFMALAGTIPPHRMGHALQRLGLPSKVCALVAFTSRYIDTLAQEYATMRTAAILRGFTPRTSLSSYRTFAWLTGMLLVRSSERSQRVYEAMRCRGFNGTFHSLDTHTPGRPDTLFMAAALLVSMTLLAADHLM